MPRTIELIVIHCSASPDGASLFEGVAGESSFRTPVQFIDAWHAKRGFRRSSAWRNTLNGSLTSIGYHFLIYTGGAIVTGRHVDEIGAHAHFDGQRSYNQRSIGVCMIGTERFAPAQWASLASLITELRAKYPDASVYGHRDLSPDLDSDGVVERHEWLKTCPGFDVTAWLARGMAPLAEDVFNHPVGKA